MNIITVCSHPEHTTSLVQSATKRGWNVHLIQVEWKGFGTKLIATYEYLKAHPEVTEFVFCDAYDVIVLGTPDEFANKVGDAKMIVSAERGLWPPILQPFKSKYPLFLHGFNYINSGCYCAKSAYFISLCEKYMPFYEIDDQYWMNMYWLLDRDAFKVDYYQAIFNSHSHMTEGEYGYDNGRVQILGNQSVFVHKNGRTIDEKLDEFI